MTASRGPRPTPAPARSGRSTKKSSATTAPDAPGPDDFVSEPVADIRTLGVVALKGDAGPALEIVRAFAQAHPEVRVYLNGYLRPHAGRGLTVQPDAVLATKVDALLSLGGDGTFLTAARLGHARGIPVLGVNLGRTGFLADASLDNLASILEDLMVRAYTLRHRLVLQVEQRRGAKTLFRDIALNEVAFAGLMGGQMAELEVKANGQFLTTYRVDGLLVSTPTGSTAHALSAGGPIIHPATHSLLLTPMNPASLSVRPLILPDAMAIEVRHAGELATGGKKARASVNIFADGRIHGALRSGDVVRITRHSDRLHIIRPRGATYFEALRNKLGWTGDRDLRSGRATSG
ncbi:MAG TPA: NAD(+)/NADH kinase [Fibrobacteria bacterium]|nr:NAD(+)/NADH kinase [Fibrobacteria bacterium]